VEQGINKWQVETCQLEGSGRTKGMLVNGLNEGD